MHVARSTQPRRRGNLPCGCLSLLGLMSSLAFCSLVGLALLMGGLPDIALRVAGFEAIGETSALFRDDAPPATPVQFSQTQPADVVTLRGTAGEQVRLDLQSYVVVGSDTMGRRLAQAQFSEADLMALCRQHTTYCSASGSVLRNGRIDLRAGGAIVWGEVNLPQTPIWQEVGIVVQIVEGDRNSVV